MNDQHDDYLIAYHDNTDWIFLDMTHAVLDTGYPYDETLERYAQLQSAYNRLTVYAMFRRNNLGQPIKLFYNGVKYGQ